MLVVKTYVDDSQIHGKGLFANEDILKDQLIWFKADNDPFVKEFHAFEVGDTSGRLNEFLLTYCWLEGQHFYLSLDNDQFTNHSDTPNTYIRDGHVFAAKDISKGEEITEDYKEFNGLYLEVEF